MSKFTISHQDQHPPAHPFFYTLDLLAGALLALAFAPISLYLFAILSPAILLFSWLHMRARQAFVAGFVFGLGFFAIGISWIYNSIHKYGNAPMSLSLLITISLVAMMALFLACQGYVFNKFFPKNNSTKILIVFPSLWIIFEWLRTWVLTGFPWLFLGYSQLDSSLRNLAPILGVYGVSFFVAFTSAAIVFLFIGTQRFGRGDQKSLTMLPHFKVLVFILVLGVWIGSYFLQHDWTKPQGSPIRTSLIQQDISIDTKWDVKKITSILRDYYQASRRHWRSKLIIWPESAIPVAQLQVTDYLAGLTREAKRHHSNIVTGIVYQAKNQPGKYLYYNAMTALGDNSSWYFKRHLVPFGEYLPLKPILGWLLNFLQIPQSDFAPYVFSQPKFMAANVQIAPFLCYEIAYPDMVLDYMPSAQLLLTISEDGWFGPAAAAQQLDIARMRSLETGRDQLFSTNTGITAIISHLGKIELRAPAFQKVVLTGDVQPRTGSTPWVSYGHYLWKILAACCLLIGLLV